MARSNGFYFSDYDLSFECVLYNFEKVKMNVSMLNSGSHSSDVHR